MTRHAYRLTQDIVAGDGAPIILAGALAVTSEDGGRVLFSRTLPVLPHSDDGPPLFDKAFLEQIKAKLDPLPLDQVPDWLLAADQTQSIPMRGWGLS